MPGLRPARAIAAAGYASYGPHSCRYAQAVCAIHDDASVSCFGGRGLGIGKCDGGRCDYVTKIPGLADVTLLGVGPHHACAARRDATIWCWGDNREGALLVRDAAPWEVVHRVPVPIVLGS